MLPHRAVTCPLGEFGPAWGMVPSDGRYLAYLMMSLTNSSPASVPGSGCSSQWQAWPVRLADEPCAALTRSFLMVSDLSARSRMGSGTVLSTLTLMLDTVTRFGMVTGAASVPQSNSGLAALAAWSIAATEAC